MPDTHDPTDDLIAWMLQNEQFKAVKAYLDRGRRYRARDAQMLKARWLILFEQTAALDFTDETERHDIEAELRLRKMEPPIEQALETLHAFKRRVDERNAEFFQDLAMRENAARYFERLVAEYEAGLAVREVRRIRLMVIANLARPAIFFSGSISVRRRGSFVATHL